MTEQETWKVDWNAGVEGACHSDKLVCLTPETVKAVNLHIGQLSGEALGRTDRDRVFADNRRLVACLHDAYDTVEEARAAIRDSKAARDLVVGRVDQLEAGLRRLADLGAVLTKMADYGTPDFASKAAMVSAVRELRENITVLLGGEVEVSK